MYRLPMDSHLFRPLNEPQYARHNWQAIPLNDDALQNYVKRKSVYIFPIKHYHFLKKILMYEAENETV
jgi:hypothetical protein